MTRPGAVSMAIVLSLSLAALTKGMCAGSDAQVSVLVRKALVFSQDDFRSIQQGPGIDGATQVVYPAKPGLVGGEVQTCDVIQKRDESILTCWIGDRSSLREAQEAYFSAIEGALPGAYSRGPCGPNAESPCARWMTRNGHDPVFLATIGRKYTGDYGARLWISKRIIP
jgi:hypothetical protein